jgi:hypothetical protein
VGYLEKLYYCRGYVMSQETAVETEEKQLAHLSEKTVSLPRFYVLVGS